MRNIALMGAVALCLAGCAPTRVWVKPGATQADFNTDEYSCEKDARQSGYFGTGFVGVANMQGFYSRCMVAHGWHFQQTSATTTMPPAATISSQTRAGEEDRLIQCKLPNGNFTYVLLSKCQAAGGSHLVY